MSCAQSCGTLCDPLDCGPLAPLSMVSLQARMLEWVAISSSRGPSGPRDQTSVSCFPDGFSTTEPLGKSVLFSHCFGRFSLEMACPQSVYSPNGQMSCCSAHGFFFFLNSSTDIKFTYHTIHPFKAHNSGSALAVQWLGLGAFTAEGAGSLPEQDTKIPQTTWPKEKKITQHSSMMMLYRHHHDQI